MTDTPDPDDDAPDDAAPAPGDDTRTVVVELGPGVVDDSGVLRPPPPKFVLP